MEKRVVPKKVKIISWIMYLFSVLIIGYLAYLLSALIYYFYLFQKLEQSNSISLVFSSLFSTSSVTLEITKYLIYILIGGGLFYVGRKLSSGKNWARIPSEIAFLVGIILLIKLELYEGGLYADLWIMGISLAIIAIFIWAIYVLICSKEVKEAFLINKN